MSISVEQFRRCYPKLVERLDNREVQVLLEAMTPAGLAPGDFISRFGEPHDMLTLVYEGGLAVTITVFDEEISIGTMGPGHLLGVAAVIEPGAASATVRAAEPSTVLRLNHDRLMRLRRDHPRVAGYLLRALSLQLAEWLRTFEGYMTARERPNDVREFARVARQLMGIKETSP